MKIGNLETKILKDYFLASHILYIIQSEYGILKHGYQVNEMKKYLGFLEFLPAIESYPINKKSGLHEYPKISLRFAAALVSNHTTDLRLAQFMRY